MAMNEQCMKYMEEVRTGLWMAGGEQLLVYCLFCACVYVCILCICIIIIIFPFYLSNNSNNLNPQVLHYFFFFQFSPHTPISLEGGEQVDDCVVLCYLPG